jgi:hypothetical protein
MSFYLIPLSGGSAPEPEEARPKGQACYPWGNNVLFKLILFLDVVNHLRRVVGGNPLTEKLID